jgi:hypothetical protein
MAPSRVRNVRVAAGLPAFVEANESETLRLARPIHRGWSKSRCVRRGYKRALQMYVLEDLALLFHFRSMSVSFVKEC